MERTGYVIIDKMIEMNIGNKVTNMEELQHHVSKSIDANKPIRFKVAVPIIGVIVYAETSCRTEVGELISEFTPYYSTGSQELSVVLSKNLVTGICDIEIRTKTK